MTPASTIAERVQAGDLVQCHGCGHTEDPETAEKHWLYSPRFEKWWCVDCELAGLTDDWEHDAMLEARLP